jgi:hypothetical protein
MKKGTDCGYYKRSIVVVIGNGLPSHDGDRKTFAKN